MDRVGAVADFARQLALQEPGDTALYGALGVAGEVLTFDSVVLIEERADSTRIVLGLPAGRTRESAAGAIVHAEARFASILHPSAGAPLRGNPDSAESRLLMPMGTGRYLVMPLVVDNRAAFGILQVEGQAFDQAARLFVTAMASLLSLTMDRDAAVRRESRRRQQMEELLGKLRGQAEAALIAERQRNERVRAPAGGLRNLSRVDVLGLVRQAVDCCQDEINDRGQNLTTSLPAGTVHMLVQEPRIIEVFTTLIETASRLASPGGRIWLTARVVDGARLVPPLRGPSWLVISLRDDGAGSFRSVIPRVFDMLHPVGAGAATETAESDLMNVQHIVELHGGTMSAVTAGLGQGSEFEVRLPVGSDATTP